MTLEGRGDQAAGSPGPGDVVVADVAVTVRQGLPWVAASVMPSVRRGGWVLSLWQGFRRVPRLLLQSLAETLGHQH